MNTNQTSEAGETVNCRQCLDTGIAPLGNDEGTDYCEACHVGREMSLEAEVNEYAGLTDRLSRLLTGTANALKGDPGPLTNHDWSDLPKVAAHLRAQLAEAVRERDELWNNNRAMLIAFASSMGMPIPKEDQPLPDFYLLRVLTVMRDAAKETARLKAEAKLWKDAHGSQTAKAFDEMVAERDATLATSPHRLAGRGE